MKNSARHRAQKSGSSADWIAYRKCKNDLKATICQAKIKYLRSSTEQSKRCPQKAAYMWSCINEVIGRFKQKSSTVNDPVSLDSINDFFQTLAISPGHKSAEEFCPDNNSSDGFAFSQSSVSTAAEQLSKLDVHKATGPDGLSARYRKEITEVIAPFNHLV